MFDVIIVRAGFFILTLIVETMTTIVDYLKRMDSYKNAPYRIRDGVGYYLVDGNEVSEQEWKDNNPIPMYFPRTAKGDENPDKKHSWQYD